MGGVVVVVSVLVVVFGAGEPMDFNWFDARLNAASTVGMTTMVSHGWVMPSVSELAAMRPTVNDPRVIAMTTQVW